MRSCDFRWARIWGWPTTELHCTETCKHLSFSPYSHCIVPPASSSSNLSTSIIIRLANTNNILSVTSLLGLILDFLHDPICPPFLMLMPKGESLWKNVFIDVEGVDGFCGYKFENGCSVLNQAMVVQDKSNISKQGAFKWCRDESSHARLLVYFTIWLASVDYLFLRVEGVIKMFNM